MSLNGLCSRAALSRSLAGAGVHSAESAQLACSVASMAEAPVLHLVESRGSEWRRLKLETVEDDAAMPPAHLMHTPSSGKPSTTPSSISHHPQSQTLNLMSTLRREARSACMLSLQLLLSICHLVLPQQRFCSGKMLSEMINPPLTGVQKPMFLISSMSVRQP